MCSKHGWLPCQLTKISLFFSLPVCNWMPPEIRILGGPSEATTLWSCFSQWSSGLKINEDKTKVMCETLGTGTTQVVGNVKHPCNVCLKGVGVNSIRCTQCVQWVHARYSRVKGSLKNVESSFICRCKGELSETRQVNGLHIEWS